MGRGAASVFLRHVKIASVQGDGAAAFSPWPREKFVEASPSAPDLRFAKMHGCANDYVVVDAIGQQVADPAALARRVSDRRRGVGADGLVLALPGERADLRMRMFNPDGSEAEMCGNGLRCLARFAARRGLVPDPLQMRVETGAGVRAVALEALDGPVTIDMGVPQLEGAQAGATGRNCQEALAVDAQEVLFTAVSLGNPHAVIFVPDVEAAPVALLGARLQCCSRFPERTNVEFVQVLSTTEVRQRTWERGAGETPACGSGACAAVAACAVAGRTGPEVTVHLRGGDLDVRWAPGGNIFLRGPAVEVFRGHWPQE